MPEVNLEYIVQYIDSMLHHHNLSLINQNTFVFAYVNAANGVFEKYFKVETKHAPLPQPTLMASSSSSTTALLLLLLHCHRWWQKLRRDMTSKYKCAVRRYVDSPFKFLFDSVDDECHCYCCWSQSLPSAIDLFLSHSILIICLIRMGRLNKLQNCNDEGAMCPERILFSWQFNLVPLSEL